VGTIRRYRPHHRRSYRITGGGEIYYHRSPHIPIGSIRGIRGYTTAEGGYTDGIVVVVEAATFRCWSTQGFMGIHRHLHRQPTYDDDRSRQGLDLGAVPTKPTLSPSGGATLMAASAADTI